MYANKYHLGDPTVFGNLVPNENILVAVEESLRSHKHNGYAPAIGWYILKLI